MGRKRTRVLSYTERETRRKPFNWYDALKHPYNYGSDILARKAKDWTTCACGTLCELIPRYTMDYSYNTANRDGAPKDTKLRKLGMKFYECVNNEQWKIAKTTLDKIEKRSVEIIAELQLDC